MKNTTIIPRSVLGFMLIILAFSACVKKEKHVEIAKVLFTRYQNPVYNQLDDDEFADVFDSMLLVKKALMTNPKLIKAFYEQNNLKPLFVLRHLPNNDLQAIDEYYHHAADHGLDQKLFQAIKLDSVMQLVASKSFIKTKKQAYETIAKLELMTANSLINYSNALQYGVISPKRIYSRYFTQTVRPDSLGMTTVLKRNDLKTFLDSIQPKSPQYLALQKALLDGETLPGMTKPETEKILKVNLERLRWKNKPNSNFYVLVNIPDYGLQVMRNDSAILRMKVCVGEGRNKDNSNNLSVDYSDSGKIKDAPFSRETPQLSSEISYVQVNPIWNIPRSIATNEIIVQASADRYYLSNKNIDVYEHGKKVENPETIDWSKINKSNLSYTFKQQSGGGNALGKIKFMFPNNSSVYLHDTPAQAAFYQSMRAVSHGCVRLEKPLDLAHVLFGDGSKYQKIEDDMSEPDPQATDITLPKKVPVYITYVTCWWQNGHLVARPDVYGLDIVLYTHMMKMLS